MGLNGRPLRPPPPPRDRMADEGKLMPFPTVPQPTSWYYGQAEVNGDTMVVLTVYSPGGCATYYLAPADAAMLGAALVDLGRAGNVLLT